MAAVAAAVITEQLFPAVLEVCTLIMCKLLMAQQPVQQAVLGEMGKVAYQYLAVMVLLALYMVVVQVVRL
jgi:hypothetical protein